MAPPRPGSPKRGVHCTPRCREGRGWSWQGSVRLPSQRSRGTQSHDRRPNIGQRRITFRPPPRSNSQRGQACWAAGSTHWSRGHISRRSLVSLPSHSCRPPRTHSPRGIPLHIRTWPRSLPAAPATALSLGRSTLRSREPCLQLHHFSRQRRTTPPPLTQPHIRPWQHSCPGVVATSSSMGRSIRRSSSHPPTTYRNPLTHAAAPPNLATLMSGSALHCRVEGS